MLYAEKTCQSSNAMELLGVELDTATMTDEYPYVLGYEEPGVLKLQFTP